MARKRIAVLVGSLRKGSYNRKMACALMKAAPDALAPEIVEIGRLPLYNQDFEDDLPAEYARFRETIRQYDGFLFVTPEYNRSMPAVLKNALDVGSRPPTQNVWNGKPAAVVSVSTGAIGGFGANHHLRQSLVFLNVPAMQQPEAYIGHAAGLFDEKGELTNESTAEFVKKFMTAFAAWVARCAADTVKS